MNILFLAANECTRNELQEYLKERQGHAYFADTVEEAIILLHANQIDLAVLGVLQIADIRLLKYINTYFKPVRVVLTVEKDIEHAISTVRNSQFGILHKPFTLKELGEIIGK